MRDSQREFTDKILFDYYLASSLSEEQVFSRVDYYLDKDIFDKMVEATEVLDKIVLRIIQSQLKNPEEKLFNYGDFKLDSKVLSLKNNLNSFFWSRFDVFQRASGGIFFSEFNYDKPCAQREIIISNMLNPKNNPNTQFENRFIEGFLEMCKSFGHVVVRVAILVGTGHYEEIYLANLYIDLMKDTGIEFIIVGPTNIEVKDGKAFAFGKDINVILRQYPTEFLFEVTQIEEILALVNDGELLIINDPRVILGQTKSLFAYLWDMVESGSTFLSELEKEIIKTTIPYTQIFHHDMKNEIISNKDKYVIKAVYGRYSEEVYIGRMFSTEDWNELLQYVIKCGEARLHIVQEFCEIKSESVSRYNGNVYSEEVAFGNFGIYLTNGKFAGICVRWSKDYLTCDGAIWSTAVGISKRRINLHQLKSKENDNYWDRDKIWQEINMEAALCHGYTDNYTGIAESFLLNPLVIESCLFDELKNATNELVEIFKKTIRLVKSNYKLFCPVLGISDGLSKLVSQTDSEISTFLGRLDWIFDGNGDLKVIEFNSETPGGILESSVLNKLIKKKVGLGFSDPNKNMGNALGNAFSKILNDYSKKKRINNVGIVSSTFHEDWYNATAIYENVKHLPYTFILGEISGLEMRDEQLYLYDTPLDALYRYYPLDMFDADSYYSGYIEAFYEKTLCINSPSTLISQSKAFFAVIWEILVKGVFTTKEIETIKKYIPRTVLDSRQLKTDDFCGKPYFEREGNGVWFNLFSPASLIEEQNYVFQERIGSRAIEISIETALGTKKELMYPVIGTYVIGDEFGGILSRAGGMITDKWSIYIPTYTLDENNFHEVQSDL